MKIVFVIGARPNFVKVAPLIKAAAKVKGLQFNLVHTGQHYHDSMSADLLRDLDLSLPYTNFHIGSGSHANQVASVMIKFESYCLDHNPDIVVVFGDVNSTLGASLAVSKLPSVKLAHVEAGCRLFDDSPEEINRILVDRISHYLFCPTEADRNYAIADNISPSKCYVTGDIAVDTLFSVLPKIKVTILAEKYAMFTLHRSFNVDDRYMLCHFLNIANEIAKHIKVIFPAHPRTLNRMTLFGLTSYAHRLDIYPPLGYLECMRFLNGAMFLLTDSGGLQIEAHFLKTPCLTLHTSTGHINTVQCNANTLVGTDFDSVVRAATNILSHPKHNILDGHFWDGRVSDRIINYLTGGAHESL